MGISEAKVEYNPVDDGIGGILDLEDTSIWGGGGDKQIATCAYAVLIVKFFSSPPRP
jgi:hypothetical protein